MREGEGGGDGETGSYRKEEPNLPFLQEVVSHGKRYSPLVPRSSRLLLLSTSFSDATLCLYVLRYANGATKMSRAKKNGFPSFKAIKIALSATYLALSAAYLALSAAYLALNATYIVFNTTYLALIRSLEGFEYYLSRSEPPKKWDGGII